MKSPLIRGQVLYRNQDIGLENSEGLFLKGILALLNARSPVLRALMVRRPWRNTFSRDHENTSESI
jgi:hypothetical protein